MLLKTDRTELHVQNPSLLEKYLSYYEKNQEHLKPWEPKRDDNYFSLDQVLNRLKVSESNFNSGETLQLAAIDPQSDNIIAIANFTGITRGPFQACFLGYSLDRDYVGKGYMFEILQKSILYVFEELHLHRIMANYMPSNKRSENLLERLGFEKEGYAREYLKINGKWEDHVLTSLIRGF